MSDWQAGDLALCVRREAPKAPYRVGRTYTVLRVHWFGALAFVEIDAGKQYAVAGGWPQEHFRKVTPPAADEFDRETIALMNSKPVKHDAYAEGKIKLTPVGLS